MTDREEETTAGVRYAATRAGIALPIVDVTHPAFALSVSAEEQRAATERFLAEPQPFAKLPRRLRSLILRVLLRGSVLAQGIRSADEGFLSGMSTYLLKLGPDNLGSYAKPIDRKIAAALPALAVRWRLADMARLLAEALMSPGAKAGLEGDRLDLLNIAGGPAIDSLNALILVRHEQPDLLSGRRIVVTVLDIDEEGAAFGARAFDALREERGPLAGLDVRLRRVPYDWSRGRSLRVVLDEPQGGARPRWRAGSSEGGLFEYGSDDEIVANLQSLRDSTPDDFVMVGSVTRADEPIRRLLQVSAAALRPRGLEAFRRLVEPIGWRVTQVIERPFSDHVTLSKA
jgi:hypothetical protein